MNPNTYYGSDLSGSFNASPRRSRRKLLLVVVSILLVATVVLGVISSLGGSGSSPKDANKIVELIAAGDGVKSYELLSVQAKSVATQESWVETVVQLKALMKNKEPEHIYSNELENGLTEHAYNIGEKGSIYRLEVTTNKEGGVELVSYNKTLL